MGKGGSRRHSTMSFSESVVVARTRKLSNVRIFSFLQSGEVLTSFNHDNGANFSGEKKSTMKNSGVSIF